MIGEASGTGIEVEFASRDAAIRGVYFEHDAPNGTKGPAIVLIPDVHGVSPLYREIGAKLAAAGFHTLVLDFYSREGAPRLADFEAVQAWIAALPDARVLADVDTAVRHLAARDDVRAEAICVLGFCLGGQYAIMAACRSDRLAAAVAFYGMLRHGRPGPAKLPPPLETAAAIRCPLLGLFGADDPLIPAADVDALRADLERSGRSFALHTFPGAGHAFMNDRRPEAYRPEAARRAMDLALAFLRDKLR